MGVKFFGNVTIPTVKIGPAQSQLGRRVFEIENLQESFILYTSDLPNTIKNTTAYAENSIDDVVVIDSIRGYRYVLDYGNGSVVKRIDDTKFYAQTHDDEFTFFQIAV